MRWTVKMIQEGDYGCEERMPGDKVKVFVILENEAGETRELLAEDDWLYAQGIDEGSVWPEEVPEEVTQGGATQGGHSGTVV